MAGWVVEFNTNFWVYHPLLGKCVPVHAFNFGFDCQLSVAWNFWRWLGIAPAKLYPPSKWLGTRWSVPMPKLKLKLLQPFFFFSVLVQPCQRLGGVDLFVPEEATSSKAHKIRCQRDDTKQGVKSTSMIVGTPLSWFALGLTILGRAPSSLRMFGTPFDKEVWDEVAQLFNAWS